MKFFVISVGVILALTGVAKLFSASGNAQMLDMRDPIVGLPFRQVMFVLGATELIVAAFCFFGKKLDWSLALIAGLSATFVMYRIALWFMKWRRPCPCLVPV